MCPEGRGSAPRPQLLLHPQPLVTAEEAREEGSRPGRWRWSAVAPRYPEEAMSEPGRWPSCDTPFLVRKRVTSQKGISPSKSPSKSKLPGDSGSGALLNTQAQRAVSESPSHLPRSSCPFMRRVSPEADSRSAIVLHILARGTGCPGPHSPSRYLYSQEGTGRHKDPPVQPY